MYKYNELNEEVKKHAVCSLLQHYRGNVYYDFSYKLFTHLNNSFGKIHYMDNITKKESEKYSTPIQFVGKINSNNLFKIYDDFERSAFNYLNYFHYKQKSLNIDSLHDIGVEFSIIDVSEFDRFKISAIINVRNCDDYILQQNIMLGIQQYFSEINIMINNTLEDIKYLHRHSNIFNLKLDLNYDNHKLFTTFFNEDIEYFLKNGDFKYREFVLINKGE